MRKAIHIVLSVLEIALVAGVFVLNYFARAKLGMNRWLNYHNRVWEEALPLQAIVIATLCVLAVLLIAAIARYVRSSQHGKAACFSIVVSGILLVACAWVALAFSTESLRAYYLVLACLALASLLQMAQSFLLLRE